MLKNSAIFYSTMHFYIFEISRLSPRDLLQLHIIIIIRRMETKQSFLPIMFFYNPTWGYEDCIKVKKGTCSTLKLINTGCLSSVRSYLGSRTEILLPFYCATSWNWVNKIKSATTRKHTTCSIVRRYWCGRNTADQPSIWRASFSITPISRFLVML